MQYQRVEECGAYKRVTTVDDNGDYKQYIQWNDGTTTGHRTDNVIAMGWKSVKEFLRERKGFVPVKNRTK